MAMAQKPIRSLVAAMTPEELFTAALGLGQQWRVVECRFEGEPKRWNCVWNTCGGNILSVRSVEPCAGYTTQWSGAGGTFSVPLRVGGEGAAHLVSQGRGVSGAGALGAGRQRFYPLDGSAHDAAKRSDARRCHGRFAQ